MTRRKCPWCGGKNLRRTESNTLQDTRKPYLSGDLVKKPNEQEHEQENSRKTEKGGMQG